MSTVLSREARQGHLLRLVGRRRGLGLLQEELASPTEDRAIVERDQLLELVTFLRNDPDADLSLLVDLTAIDHAGESGVSTHPRGRFEVLYHLRSPDLHYRLWLSTFIPEDDAVVPSMTALYPAADWYERELWDLFGIYADGHPYLRHLLLYSGFSGHPMRADYPARKAQPLVAMRMRSRAPVVIRSEPSAPAEAQHRVEAAGVDETNAAPRAPSESPQ